MFVKTSRTLIVVATMGLAIVVVPAASTHKNITVGEFAVKVSRALGHPTDGAVSASQTLRMAGAHLDDDLGKTLTVGRAADIMHDLGAAAVVSGDPAAPMSPAKADVAANTVALGVAAAPDSFSPDALPTFCNDVGSRKECSECCLAVLLPLAGKQPIKAFLACGIICTKLFPPPSASEPTP